MSSQQSKGPSQTACQNPATECRWNNPTSPNHTGHNTLIAFWLMQSCSAGFVYVCGYNPVLFFFCGYSSVLIFCSYSLVLLFCSYSSYSPLMLFCCYSLSLSVQGYTCIVQILYIFSIFNDLLAALMSLKNTYTSC